MLRQAMHNTTEFTHMLLKHCMIGALRFWDNMLSDSAHNYENDSARNYENDSACNYELTTMGVTPISKQ